MVEGLGEDVSTDQLLASMCVELNQRLNSAWHHLGKRSTFEVIRGD